jgi:membrane-associated phospholipid phosphatase
MGHRYQAAEVISHAFNPPIVAAFAFLLMLLVTKSHSFFFQVAISTVFGTLIPLAILYGLMRKRIIPDFFASRRESRTIPFLGAIASYIAGTVALFFAEAPVLVIALMLCYVVNSLIMMTVTLRWKISIHASGIAGPATALAYALGPRALPLFLLLLPVGWARVKLKAHTLTQVLVGAILTTATTWLQVVVYSVIL